MQSTTASYQAAAISVLSACSSYVQNISFLPAHVDGVALAGARGEERKRAGGQISHMQQFQKPMHHSLLLLVPEVLDKVKVRLDLGRILMPCFMVVHHVNLLVIVQHQSGDAIDEVGHAWTRGAVQIQHLGIG